MYTLYCRTYNIGQYLISLISLQVLMTVGLLACELLSYVAVSGQVELVIGQGSCQPCYDLCYKEAFGKL